MKHWLEYAAARIVGGFLRLFPRSFRLGCGRLAGGLAFAFDKRHRDMTVSHVNTAFGEEKSAAEKEAIARGAFRHFGAMLFELLTIARPSAAELEELFELDGVERYEEARRRGKGVILVAAHFGNWELHAVAHGYRFGRIHLVAREQDNRYLNRWLEEFRRTSGNDVIYKERALRQMRKLMRDGETVAFVIDQNVHLEDAVFVDFFGVPAATTPAASWFALKTGAVLMPAFCYPLPDGRYRAVYEDPIDFEPYRDLDAASAVRELTQKLVGIQEGYIRRYPQYWLWMHRRWRTRPPDELEAPAPELTTAAGGLR